MDDMSLIPARERLLARLATMNNVVAAGIAGWLAIASLPVQPEDMHVSLPPMSSLYSMDFVSGGTATVMHQAPGGMQVASGGLGSGSGSGD